VLFVHFGQVDVVGHESGWGSTPQLRAVRRADEAFGVVQAALDARRLGNSTLMILTADHGGVGLLHPPDDPLSQLIPWIAAGPSIRRNFDLGGVPGLSVNTMSTFATVCAMLGISVEHAIDGAPVMQILERPAR
jgi:arylsulfatase A-like enzyme